MTVPAFIQPCVKVLLIPELVHSIARYLRPFERHRARLISQAFYVAFSPYIFLQLNHVLTIQTGVTTASISQEQLATLGYLVRKYSTKTCGSIKEDDYPFANPQNNIAFEQCHHVQEVHVDWTGGDASHLQGTPDLEAILSGFNRLKVLHLQMWRLSCLNEVLPLVTQAKLVHLESLTLTSHRFYPPFPISWASLEEVLDNCPSLRKLDLTAFQFDQWSLSNPDWTGDYGLGPNEIPPFKVFPRMESLVIRNSSLMAKGLVFLSLCFPRLESLELDRCGRTWRDALFDLEIPRPAPVNDQPIPVPDPETRYLNLPDLERLTISFSPHSCTYRARWSLRRMVQQMPSLMSLDINTVHWTVANLREMAEYCSKPEVNQSFERLWVNIHLTGRNTHWDLQSVLNLPCFHRLREFQVEKEAVLTKLLPKRHFHFASTLTTLRFGLPRIRFEDHILYLMNQHLLPNLPNLEVLILDSKLAGYLLFRGLGYCPEDEERLPKAVKYQRYQKHDGQLVVQPAFFQQPESIVPANLVVAQQDETQAAESQVAIESQVVDSQAAIEPQDVGPQAVVESQNVDPQAAAESQDVDPQADAESLDVEPQTAVEHQEAIEHGATEYQEMVDQNTTDQHTAIHNVVADHQDTMDGQEEAHRQEEDKDEVHQDVTVDHPGSAPPELVCMADPNTTTEGETIDQMVVSMAKLGGLKLQDQDEGATLSTAKEPSLLEHEPYHEYWHPRERPFLRELDITFTGRCHVTMDDIHEKIIRRFRLLETLNVEWSKHLDVKEWRDRPEIRDDQRLAGMKVQHRMRPRYMP
ncbi:hypothetical protein BGZ82_009720 [Podila clonocystis]|nr:hypothetical protein BGZ82_009720 [Podila clonocystis]